MYGVVSAFAFANSKQHTDCKNGLQIGMGWRRARPILSFIYMIILCVCVYAECIMQWVSIAPVLLLGIVFCRANRAHKKRYAYCSHFHAFSTKLHPKIPYWIPSNASTSCCSPLIQNVHFLTFFHFSCSSIFIHKLDTHTLAIQIWHKSCSAFHVSACCALFS